MTKQLSVLLGLLPDGVIRPGAHDPVVTGLAYDSRMVKPGSLFFALDGVHADGHRFIADALAHGASGVVHGRELVDFAPRAVYCRVADTRAAMARLAAAFFDEPSGKLVTVGVTGTDGKSTTVYLICQLLESLGIKAGFLSTVSFKPGDQLEKNPFRQSTPESPLVQEMLRLMLDNGRTHAVVEATSHGLSARTRRLERVGFDVAVLTNVTHEHLEFHGSPERYLDDKTNLFRVLDPALSSAKGVPAFGVANRDDKSFDYLAANCAAPVRSYSLCDASADFLASDIHSSLDGSSFSLRAGGPGGGVCPVRSGLPGNFNVENLLAAIAAVSGLPGVEIEALLPHLPGLRGVPGRLQALRLGQPFSVIVDYAHTPGAFEKLFPLVRGWSAGRLIAVFGSAGERDTAKRPLQGAIAGRHADLLVLTDEDPRGEDPLGILRDIAAGAGGRHEGLDLLLIPDRREAIRAAFRLARPGDTVVLLGKGHESSIIGRDGPLEWDEPGVAREILGQMGYGGPGQV